jgi:hypothetical protein
MDFVGRGYPMIKEPISLAQVASDRFNGFVPKPKSRRRRDELHPRARDLSQETSTAVLLPFPTRRARMGRRGRICDVAHARLGLQSHEDLDWGRTAGSAVFDFVVLAFVLASVACGPVLVWVLLRMAY